MTDEDQDRTAAGEADQPVEHDGDGVNSAEAAEVAEAAVNGSGDRPAGRAADEATQKPDARERRVKLILLTIAAGLAATILSVLTSSASSHPAAEAIDDAESGQVEAELFVAEGDDESGTRVVSRFTGADYEHAIVASADSASYTDGDVQLLRYVGGSFFYRPADSAPWAEVDGPEDVTGVGTVDLAPLVEADPTRGVGSLVDALDVDLDDDFANGDATGVITVGDARSMDERPPIVDVLVEENWGWPDDQPIDVTVSVEDGTIAVIEATIVEATTAQEARTVVASALYGSLDNEITIERP